MVVGYRCGYRGPSPHGEPTVRPERFSDQKDMNGAPCAIDLAFNPELRLIDGAIIRKFGGRGDVFASG